MQRRRKDTRGAFIKVRASLKYNIFSNFNRFSFQKVFLKLWKLCYLATCDFNITTELYEYPRHATFYKFNLKLDTKKSKRAGQ